MDYCSEAGNNLIEERHEDQKAEVQAEFDTVLKFLQITQDWHGMKEFTSLNKKGLCEIRFKVGNVQYRPTGSFGPGSKTFTIWIGCCKKMNIYDPPNAFNRALKRRSLYEQGRATIRERSI